MSSISVWRSSLKLQAESLTMASAARHPLNKKPLAFERHLRARGKLE